jgi:hypothetical protein
LSCSACPQGYKGNATSSSKCHYCPLKYKSTAEENSTTCT